MTSSALDPMEASATAARFGVAVEQVRRDHLISHVLAALSRSHREDLIFFGGTALSRTYLPTGRLSEDIDLIAVEARRPTAATIERTLVDALRRSHGRVVWTPRLVDVRDTEPALLRVVDEQLAVRIHLLSSVGQQRWPTQIRSLEQRCACCADACSDSGVICRLEDGGMARPARGTRPLRPVGIGRVRWHQPGRSVAFRQVRPVGDAATAVDVRLPSNWRSVDSSIG